MINYYEYETSPRKEKELPKRKKSETTVNTRDELRKQVKRAQIIETKKNIRHIIQIGIAFVVLLTISYRYALINSRFTEKESLKSTLSELQKQNAQLKVSIEQGMKS